MPINFDTALGNHEAALHLRARRMEMLASNLVNADTPNYKARDFDFRAALDGERRAMTLRTTRDGHMGAGEGGQAPIQAMYRTPSQPSLDGNTVDVQVERALFGENAMRYQATLQFLGGRFKGMMNALRGK